MNNRPALYHKMISSFHVYRNSILQSALGSYCLWQQIAPWAWNEDAHSKHPHVFLSCDKSLILLLLLLLLILPRLPPLLILLLTHLHERKKKWPSALLVIHHGEKEAKRGQNEKKDMDKRYRRWTRIIVVEREIYRLHTNLRRGGEHRQRHRDITIRQRISASILLLGPVTLMAVLVQQKRGTCAGS